MRVADAAGGRALLEERPSDAVLATGLQGRAGAREKLRRDVAAALAHDAVALIEHGGSVLRLDPGSRARRAEPTLLLGAERDGSEAVLFELARERIVRVVPAVVAALPAEEAGADEHGLRCARVRRVRFFAAVGHGLIIRRLAAPIGYSVPGPTVPKQDMRMAQMTQKVLVPIAEGFEEIEAVTIIDVLRRAELDVTVAGLGSAGPILGSRGIRIQPDLALDELDLAVFDVIVLPGGLGCTEALMGDEMLLASLRAHHGAGKLTAAICAAPRVLAEAGVIDGVPVTSHPSVRGKLGKAEVRDAPRVIHSGNVMTSQGAGTAMEFALALVEELCGADKASELATAMVVPEAVPSA